MITAGLTGGIATGKSTVAGFLAEAGADIIDADKIARDVVQQGKPAWRAVVDRFGEEILDAGGDIDRRRLGDIVFRSPGEKEALNRIVHPYVFEEMTAAESAIRAERPDAVVILDVPLLFEVGMDGRIPEVIVVYAPERRQIKRLMARNDLSREDAMARIRSQMDIEEKRERAAIVIDNSGDLERTKSQTMAVYERLNRGLS
jgi:dephospho-CoA kinase